jgi:cysteine-rich repeat protein
MKSLSPRWLGSLVLASTLVACGDDEVAPLDDTGSGGATSTSSSTSNGSTASPSSTSSSSDGGGGEGGGTGGEGGSYDGACTPLEIGDTRVYFESVAWTGVLAKVTPNVEGEVKTRLAMELYADDGSGVLPPLEPGDFDLSVAPDDNYGTCQHCVLLVTYDDSDRPTRVFSAKNGTMHVETVDDFEWSLVVGSVERSELVEVTQNPDFTWEEVPGGDCYYVDEWTFDTTPVDGGPCESAEECPNEVYQVCDPASGTCVPGQCSLTFDPPFCPDGQGCFSQLFAPDEVVQGPAVGACYDICDPQDPGSCADDAYTCRPLGPTQGIGLCYRLGDLEEGDACVPRDISTECVEGSVCIGEEGRCARICTFLTEEAGCDAGTACTLADLCEPDDVGDEAAIDELCATSSPEQFECGLEGDSFRGLCLKHFYEDVDLYCERLCRTQDPECPGDEECLGIFGNPEVGICHVPAVCGDGELDVVGGELCDDGNDEGGDACSADCQTSDLGFLCGAATPLELDADIEGTTVDGPSGYTTECDVYIATQVATYSFTPPAPGQLRIDLSEDGDAELGLSVLADCADSASELECLPAFGLDSLFIDITELDPLLIAVRGASPSQVGPFTLRASYRVATCGDGEVDGAEACDDGNEEGGDGCSADCSAIDWEAVCEALPTLALGETTGTTEGGSSFFDLRGTCSFGRAHERAFSFEAPDDGWLELELAQPDANLSLYIADGCGPVEFETYLSCSNGFPEGESEATAVELEGGQVVTVVVSGFAETEAGDFTLTAEFEPL